MEKKPMDQPTLRTVTAENVEDLGFFCYKSKPKSQGYQNKLAWLQERFQEGLTIKIVYEGDRSVGFIEYIPGEFSWRVVEAPDQFVIHCLWVVGRAKGKGYGSRLLKECIQDAQEHGKSGVTMVSSQGNWLANEKVFLRNGFQVVSEATPSFRLLVHSLNGSKMPAFPDQWEGRAERFGKGMTVVYSDQCPYVPDAVSHAREIFESRGISTQAVKLSSAAEVREQSPSPYGVYGIVLDGELFCYHYIGTKQLRRLEALLSTR
jgi:ribosomal protein S18 acetylase RimI-like enzyme